MSDGDVVLWCSERGHSNLMGRWEREVEEEDGESMVKGREEMGCFSSGACVRERRRGGGAI